MVHANACAKCQYRIITTNISNINGQQHLITITKASYTNSYIIVNTNFMNINININVNTVINWTNIYIYIYIYRYTWYIPGI